MKNQNHIKTASKDAISDGNKVTTKRLQNAGYISKTDSILAVICIIPVWICRNYS